MKIILEVNKCIGCGSCSAICPKYFGFQAGKAILLNSKKIGDNFELEVEDLDSAEDAVNVCPAQCILVEK